jgi:hypothetical protein
MTYTLVLVLTLASGGFVKVTIPGFPDAASCLLTQEEYTAQGHDGVFVVSVEHSCEVKP